MKFRITPISIGLVLCLVLLSPAVTVAQHNQVLPGTQIRLTLLNGLSTSTSRDGDPFVAVISEPVFYGGRMVLPGGARITGQVGSVSRPRRFSYFRGQAYLNLRFHAIEIDSRLIPVQMSILALENPSVHGKQRKDVKVQEGQVVEARHDVKGDVVTAAVGTGGGTLAGAVFNHIGRGMGIGLAGSAAYIMARRGKEVELPSQTVLVVRLDNTISVPRAMNAAYNFSSQ